MKDRSQGKMFPAGERSLTETDWFRSYNTFNSGNYQNEHKSPFGDLFVLNDDTLGGGKNFRLLVEEDALVILIPTVGAIVYTDSLGNEAILEAGQMQAFATPKDTTILIGNAYEEELINFIQLWIKNPETSSDVPVHSSIDMKNNPGKLLEIRTGSSRHKAFIGKFAGREEAVYKLRDPASGLFVLVLEGAFEVQYRLLETRDGLALWNLEEAELEALSNDAIILLVELPV